MKTIVLGLGIQGHKRKSFAGKSHVGSVDPFNPAAEFKDIHDVPLSNFDAAFVCTPDEPKISLLTYLIENKKHVLVEKPLLTSSNDEIQKLSLLAKKNGVTCYTAYNHRFEPHFVNLKRIIDENTLGSLYLLKMFYGNGTARDVRDSRWRDSGQGVLPDIGSHLLDTILFFFNRTDLSFEPLQANCMENKSLDHVLFGTKSGVPCISLEATLLSWRNTFRLDLFGEKGSAHIDCLCKWGPSSLIVRGRVLPSGRPDEKIETLSCKDPTWEIEHNYFLSLCKTGQCNLENDLWINRTLNGLATSLRKSQ